MKEKLELRKKIKNKKPDFVREGAYKRKEVGVAWRKPKGLHSKMRHRFSGHRAMPNPGYGSPALVKGLHKSGLKPVIVHNSTELLSIDSKTQGAIIARTTGKRTKAGLLSQAKQKGIKILNVKDTDKAIEEINKSLAKRKEAKKKLAERKKTKDKEKAKTEEQKKAETEKTPEEKKEETKKELDKALIKRER